MIKTFVSNKKIITIVTSLLFIIFLIFILLKIVNNDAVWNVKKFITNDTKVLYISSKKNYSKYPIELLKKYDIDYLYINSDKLTKLEKTRLEKLINSKYLNDIIVIFRNGKVEDAIIEYGTLEKLNSFLIDNEIIPDVLGDISSINTELENALNKDLTIIYLPYISSDNIDSTCEILEEIKKEYNIDYQVINAYLLSNNQKEKLNSIIQVSNVDKHILLFVKNQKIVGSLRQYEDKLELIDYLNEINFIDDDRLEYINDVSLNEIISDNKKSVILISSRDYKYYEDLKKEYSTIISDYNIKIYNLEIDSKDNETVDNIKKILENYNFSDNFSTPFTMIVENGKIIDYFIGLSEEQFVIDKLKENGIINKE